MAGRCPVCFVRLPLSGEPNCDCEPPTMRQTGRNGDLSRWGAFVFVFGGSALTMGGIALGAYLMVGP